MNERSKELDLARVLLRLIGRRWRDNSRVVVDVNRSRCASPTVSTPQ